MNSPVRLANEVPFADDLLKGAGQIAAFLFGDAKQRRRIYWLAQNRSLPVFKIGGRIHARRSTLQRWIREKEAAGESCLSPSEGGQ